VRYLVLVPQPRALEYSVLDAGLEEPVDAGKLDPFDPSEVKPSDLASRLHTALFANKMAQLDMVAIRCPFGGLMFEAPARVSAETLEKLESLVPFAPLHLPALIELARRCEEAFVDVPIIIVFETSFFAALPPYERRYGLDPDAATGSAPCRFGYHGIFHAAACRSATQNLEGDNVSSTPRIISICLEPQPEIAAVMGHRPMMVTSGATPLEGLPGHTTCGELDPSIVLTLADKLHWGPEQINGALTMDSGLLGLTGSPVTMASLWKTEGGKCHLARKIIDYRILQACGASIAALGNVDAVVFSGRFADNGNVLGPWLVSKLQSLPGLTDKPPIWMCFREPLDRIIAEIATTVAL
jgi:acetate kinase